MIVCSKYLVSSLVNIASGVVEDTQHGNETIGCSVCLGDGNETCHPTHPPIGQTHSSNVAASRADTVGGQPNPTSRLGDKSTSLQCLIDTL